MRDGLKNFLLSVGRISHNGQGREFLAVRVSYQRQREMVRLCSVPPGGSSFIPASGQLGPCIGPSRRSLLAAAEKRRRANQISCSIVAN